MWLHPHGLCDALEQGHLPNTLPSIQNQGLLATAFQTAPPILFVLIATITDEICIRHVYIAHIPAELLEPLADPVDSRHRKHPK